MDNIISGINVSGQVYTILDPNAIHESEFNAYSGAVDTSLSSKASQTTVDALNDVVTAHTADTSIHLTSGDIETIISSQTAYFVTGEELSSYTYDKATIDSKIASGGTFDPTQYYNKTATDELLAEKLDASAYTPTDLSNYYNKQEVDGIVASAKTEIEGEIPSLSGYATEQWVLDKNYITGVDLSNYATKSEIPTVPTNVSAFNNDAGYLTEHQSLSAYSTTEQMNSAITEATSGKANSSDVYLKSETSGATQIQDALNAKADPYSAGTGISISGNVISATGGGGGGISSAECQTMIDSSISGKANSSDVVTNIESFYDENPEPTAFALSYTKGGVDEGIELFRVGSGLSVTNIGSSSEPTWELSATGGGGAESTVSALTCYKEAIPSDINYSEGSITTFYLKFTGGGGWGNTSYNFNIYNNGVDEYKNINAGYNAGVFTSVTSSDSAYTATIDNGNIKVVLTNGCSFKRCSSSTNCTPFLITQYSSGTTSDVMVNTVYDAICRLSDKNINNFIKRVDGYIGDGKLYLYNQGTLGSINTTIEIASNTINTDGGKLNVHFTGETQHDAIINTGSGNYCELFSLYEYSKGKDDITMTMNSAYTGSYTITPFSISFIDSSNNRHQFNFEYNITANTISTPSGYATYGTIVDTLSTDYKVKFLPNTGYKIASFMNNSCLIGGVDNGYPNNYISNLVTTTSYDYNGQEIIDDLYSKIPKIWCGTQAEYEQILVKDPNTLYLIHS